MNHPCCIIWLSSIINSIREICLGLSGQHPLPPIVIFNIMNNSAFFVAEYLVDLSAIPRGNKTAYIHLKTSQYFLKISPILNNKCDNFHLHDDIFYTKNVQIKFTLVAMGSGLPWKQ